MEWLGGMMRKRPLVVLIATLLGMASTWSTGTLFADEPHRSWVDWAVLAFSAYGLLLGLVLIDRVIVRGRGTQSANQVSAIRWAVAAAPWLMGFAGLTFGAAAWSSGIAVAVSVLLLLHATWKASTNGDDGG